MRSNRRASVNLFVGHLHWRSARLPPPAPAPYAGRVVYGFTPAQSKRLTDEVRSVLRASIAHGLGNPPVRWIMLEALFTGGVTIYAFYAMQPYLLELYGNQRAFAIAGLDTVDALSLARPPRIGGQRSRRRVAATVTLE